MLSRDAIIAELNATEPDLARLASTMDHADVATVEALTAESETRTRANAITLLSLVDAEVFWRILPRAVQDPDALVRIQSVRSLENLKPEALEQRSDLIVGLLKDTDAGVRKFAIRSAVGLSAASVKQALEQVAASDRETFLRNDAAQALRSPR